MKKGEIVKTKLTRRNCKDGIKLLIEEIQEDAFSKSMGTIRGRRVFKDGHLSVGVIDCPMSEVVE